MEDINSLKIYIQNNYPNIAICGDNNCLVVTNCPRQSKIYQKVKDKIDAREINEYVKEFKMISRLIFTNMKKLDDVVEYRKLCSKLSVFQQIREFASFEIVVTKWNFEHDSKNEILTDILFYPNNKEYRVIFKDQEIMFIYENYKLCPSDNIDEDLSKRTKALSHIINFECEEGEGYYYKEKHLHENCIEIMNYKNGYTEYYEGDVEVKQSFPEIPKLLKEEEEENYQLNVRPYDMVCGIYEEVSHNFLVIQEGEEVCCIGKLNNGEIIKLTDTDKTICSVLGIKYKEF